MTLYERALAESIVEHYYANCDDSTGRKPIALRLQHSEVMVMRSYVNETLGPPVLLDHPPEVVRILGMQVIEVPVAPTDPHDRFIYGPA